MNPYKLKWQLKPLDNPTAPYRALIVLEQFVNNVWTSIYETTEYRTNLPYAIDVDPTGRYRVTATVTTLGRTYSNTSNILYGPDYTSRRKSVELPGDIINPLFTSINSNAMTPTIVRTYPKKIQYEGDPDYIDFVKFGNINSTPSGVTKIVYNLIQYAVDDEDTLGMMHTTAINRGLATVITRLNGSSIGN